MTSLLIDANAQDRRIAPAFVGVGYCGVQEELQYDIWPVRSALGYSAVSMTQIHLYMKSIYAIFYVATLRA